MEDIFAAIKAMEERRDRLIADKNKCESGSIRHHLYYHRATEISHAIHLLKGDIPTNLYRELE